MSGSRPAGDEPALLLGLGPIPAPMARDLLRDTDAPLWLRRVFTRPTDGALHTKQLPGWRSGPGPSEAGGAAESVDVTTPTGHTYTSRPPPLPGRRTSARPATSNAA